MPSGSPRRHRFVALAAVVVGAAACATPALAIIEGDQPPPIVLDPNIAGGKSRLGLDADTRGSQSGGDSAIKSVVLSGPRGLVVDPRSRAKRCSPAQARKFTCPKESKIGSGQAYGRASGAIVPGGQQNFTADLEAFLAPPVHKGDIAGAVLQATEMRSGLRATVTGRIVRARRSKSPYGVRLRFDDFPSYSGLTLSVDHITLMAGAWRKGHSLLRNPPKCDGGSWPFRIDVVYTDHSSRSDLAAECRAR